MTTVDQQEFQQRMQRVEALVQEIEGLADPAAQAAAQHLVQALLDLHGAAFGKLIELLSENDGNGRATLDACVRDELVGSVLLLHDLHPWDLRTRVQHALERVQPLLESKGADVELLSVSDDAVRLRLQMRGKGCGCGSSPATLKQTIEQAVCDGAPEVSTIDIEGAEEPASSGLVQLGLPDDGRVAETVQR